MRRWVSEPLRVLLAVFAVYRLSALLAFDDGPADVFLRIRGAAGAYQYGEDGRPARAVGRLVSCPHCLGVWFAVLCAALVVWRTGVGDSALLILGLAGAASWLQGRET